MQCVTHVQRDPLPCFNCTQTHLHSLPSFRAMQRTYNQKYSSGKKVTGRIKFSYRPNRRPRRLCDDARILKNLEIAAGIARSQTRFPRPTTSKPIAKINQVGRVPTNKPWWWICSLDRRRYVAAHCIPPTSPLRASAGGAAVQALVAGAVAHHDGATIRATGSIVALIDAHQAALVVGVECFALRRSLGGGAGEL